MAKVNYTFSLNRIELIEKSMYWERVNNDLPFQFALQIQVVSNSVENESHHIADVKVLQDKSSDTEIARVKLNCVFHVPDILQYQNNKTQQIQLPDEFMLLLNTVVIGTARGVMFSEFRGTFLHQTILPVIDPTQLENTKTAV